MPLRKLVGLLLSALMLAGLLAAGCSSAPSQGSDEAFLKTHGWTVAEKVSEQTVQLPNSFTDKPGAFPIGFYWAYNNQLSKDIGLDFQPLAGKEVTATLYRLNETLADENPNRVIQAVLLHHQGKIVGAYLDRAGHTGFAASLKRRTFREIVNLPLGQWMEQAKVIDRDDPTSQVLLRLSPEQVVHTFYDALNQHQYEKAYTMLSLPHRLQYLFSNRDPGQLYNASFAATLEPLENIRRAKVLQIRPMDETGGWSDLPELNRNPHQVHRLMVNLDLTFDKVVSSNNGRTVRFITLVRESPDSPWLLDTFGTGP